MFHVVSAASSDNAILGGTTITALNATITLLPHLNMKFPTEFGVGEVIDYQAVA